MTRALLWVVGLLVWLAQGSTSGKAPLSFSGTRSHVECSLNKCGECPGSGVGKGLQWLRESPAKDGSGNVSVGIHPRTLDLECYIKTVWRDRIASNDEQRSSTPTKSVVIAVYGEFHRLDLNSTLTQIVHPYTEAGYEVSVSLTLQTSRIIQTGWHNTRFDKLKQANMTQEEVQAVIRRFTSTLIDQGVREVFIHCSRRPPARLIRVPGAASARARGQQPRTPQHVPQLPEKGEGKQENRQIVSCFSALCWAFSSLVRFK